LTPAWTAADWKPTAYGGNFVYLRQWVLPSNCHQRRTDVKIEAPPNLYEPAADAVDVFLRYATGYAGTAPLHLYNDSFHFRSLDLSRTFGSSSAHHLRFCGLRSGPYLSGAGRFSAALEERCFSR
jgi:hypothetical protein